ncbi:sugar phosphate isomerase/epimerase [Corynebacterium sp. TAE3-ERU12]|uniref:TIM barrel protein n=1 Tax=Corynebacterium sp. TAE3-ERU12 TaxID=2849491 RepID=UPI001C460F66|nr:TIM barrel protein [Corynebacterium sp. TAE3-ERU12]MBV7295170.1 sugar phosphate isomerase/epimerase [Corynebacterium sp. TAE3-ERU12]
MNTHIVNCSTVFAGLDTAAAAAAAARAGYRRVEYWWPFPSPVPADDDVDAFLAGLREAGVHLAAMNLFGGDLGAGERGVLHIRQLPSAHLDIVAHIAAETGMTMSNLLPGAGGPEILDIQRERIAEIADYLRPHGVTTLLEPMSGNAHLPVRDPWVGARLAHDTGCGLLLDFFHCAALGIDTAAYLADAADDPTLLPAHVQIADFPGRGAPGTGKAPIAQWIEQLRAAGYHGDIADEWYPTAN